MGDAVTQPLGAGGRWQQLQESSAPDPPPRRPRGGRRGQDGGVMGLDLLQGFISPGLAAPLLSSVSPLLLPARPQPGKQLYFSGL